MLAQKYGLPALALKDLWTDLIFFLIIRSFQWSNSFELTSNFTKLLNIKLFENDMCRGVCSSPWCFGRVMLFLS